MPESTKPGGDRKGQSRDVRDLRSPVTDSILDRVGPDGTVLLDVAVLDGELPTTKAEHRGGIGILRSPQETMADTVRAQVAALIKRFTNFKGQHPFCVVYRHKESGRLSYRLEASDMAADVDMTQFEQVKAHPLTTAVQQVEAASAIFGLSIPEWQDPKKQTAEAKDPKQELRAQVWAEVEPRVLELESKVYSTLKEAATAFFKLSATLTREFTAARGQKNVPANRHSPFGREITLRIQETKWAGLRNNGPEKTAGVHLMSDEGLHVVSTRGVDTLGRALMEA